MLKVVLDTNIIVSANLNAQGMEALAVRLASNKVIQLCISPPILAEYENVLKRPKFKFAPDLIEGVLQLIRDTGLLLTDLPQLRVLADAKDDCSLHAQRPLERTTCLLETPSIFLPSGMPHRESPPESSSKSSGQTL